MKAPYLTANIVAILDNDLLEEIGGSTDLPLHRDCKTTNQPANRPATTNANDTDSNSLMPAQSPTSPKQAWWQHLRQRLDIRQALAQRVRSFL